MAMISIHKMDRSDLMAVHDINSSSFSAPWSLQAIEDEYHNDLAYYLVAKEAGKTVGFIGAWIILDEVQITNIAVDPAYRNQGIGKKLLGELIDRMQELPGAVIFLEVRVSNTAALKLYESFNFEYVGYRKQFYQDQEDAHLMRLHLN